MFKLQKMEQKIHDLRLALAFTVSSTTVMMDSAKMFANALDAEREGDEDSAFIIESDALSCVSEARLLMEEAIECLNKT